jgi:tellurite resistance protein
MIIFGTRGVTYTAERGDFFCPSCSDGRDYAQKRVRRFFTLYFIPLVPLNVLGEYVECDDCKGTYQLSVLDYDPNAANAAFEAEYARGMKRVMVLMMMVDGDIDDDEISAVRDLYGRVCGGQLSEADVRAEIDAATADGRGVSDFIGSMAGTLNDNGKELVIKAAYAVAAADGVFADEEMELLAEIGQALLLSKAHYRGLLAELGEGG